MPNATRPIRILYVGDSWLTGGTLSAFSSLTYDLRGVSVENQAEKIIENWRASPDFGVDYVTAWDALARFPETEDALRHYDVIFLSDVESDSIVLYPPDRSLRAPMGPNRLKLIREFVRAGGGLAMIGAYASFTGRHNAGNYHGTAVEEVLPVDCLTLNDDRIETPEGITAALIEPDHPILRGTDWDGTPIVNGYNRLSLKASARVLARFRETNDPLLAVGAFGEGRSLAFASDISPHWGAGFQDWKYCAQFINQMAPWLAGSSRV